MKYILTLMATIATSIATAQNLPTLPVGVVFDGSTYSIAEVPSSTIMVDISLTTTKFTAGIYARYAQKFLGERAPLINRESITINSSSVALAPQDYFVAQRETTPDAVSHKSPASTLPAHVTSANITIPESAAESVAKQIFANRKLSYDLIAGNIGEGVFGAGLTSALDKLERTERENLALFMGNEESSTLNKRFTIDVKSDTKRYMICRYDTSKGIISANDIDGEPVYLQITPAVTADTTYTLAVGKSPQQKSFVSANRARCDLYVGAEIINSVTLPLYDFGQRTTIIYDPK